MIKSSIGKFKTDGFGLRPLIQKETGRVGLNYFLGLVIRNLPMLLGGMLCMPEEQNYNTLGQYFFRRRYCFLE